MLVLLWRKVQLKTKRTVLRGCTRCVALYVGFQESRPRPTATFHEPLSGARADPIEGQTGLRPDLDQPRLRSRVWTPKPACTVGSFVGSLCKNCASTGYNILGLE